MKFLLLPFVAALGVVHAAASASAASDNLLLNPSFEYETAADFHACMHWKMGSPNPHGDAFGSARRENWRAQEGFYALALRGTWAHVGDSGGCWQEVPAVPGTVYRCSAWTWADAAWTAQTCELKLEFWKADRTRLLGIERIALKDLGETWREQSFAATAPENTAWVRLVVHVSGAGPDGSLLLDNLALRVEAP